MAKRSDLIEEIENYQADGYTFVSADAKKFAISLFAEIETVPHYYVMDDSASNIRIEFKRLNNKELRISGTYIYWQHDDKFKDSYGIVRNLTPQKIKNALIWLTK